MDKMPWLSELVNSFHPLTYSSSNSIVFVGDPICQNVQAWEESFGPEDWFKEALPRQLINTRSFYYEYRSPSSCDSSAETIELAARDFLSEWSELKSQPPPSDRFEGARRRNEGPSRPVLFVCQSLGGRIVEEVLRAWL